MSKGYRLGPWKLENWSRMALPFAVLLLCSLPALLDSDNAALVLLYTLLPLYMLHQYEEHAHGKFVDFFNSTVGEGCPVLTKSSDFLINVLGVWLVFFVSFYPAKYAFYRETQGVGMQSLKRPGRPPRENGNTRLAS